MMKMYELEKGTIVSKAPSYICSDADFEMETDAPDGSTLVVISESSHKVLGSYIAFNGNWNSL